MVEAGLPGGDPVSLFSHYFPGKPRKGALVWHLLFTPLSPWLWGPLPLVQAARRWVQSPGSRPWSRQPDTGCRVQAAALGPGSQTLGAESGPQPCEGFAVRAPSGLGLAVLLGLWVLLLASVLNLWPLF